MRLVSAVTTGIVLVCGGGCGRDASLHSFPTVESPQALDPISLAVVKLRAAGIDPDVYDISMWGRGDQAEKPWMRYEWWHDKEHTDAIKKMIDTGKYVVIIANERLGAESGTPDPNIVVGATAYNAYRVVIVEVGGDLAEIVK